jgi:tRNA/tmRNA/rRNA uracil-C5-methylase (TrmA/RlmC/RlmD family)
MKDGCVFGLYKQGSHEILPIPMCKVHHPAINAAIDVLEQATTKAGISAYSENSRDGDLRYVQLQVERVTGKVCLTLVWNAATLKECQPALARLVKELNKQAQEQWHSIWCHCNDSLGNNIFSKAQGRWHRLSGPEFLREPFPVEAAASNNKSVGWFYFTPLTFRQGNLDGFDILALDVARAVAGGSKVCELYGGVGVLGLTALAYHHEQQQPLQWLRCSDENPSNARCFHRAVDSLPKEMTGRQSRRGKRGEPRKRKHDDDEGMTLAELAQLVEANERAPLQNNERGDSMEKTSYMIATAGKALKSGQALGAEILIVDPPRRGLEDEVLDELCKPFNSHQPYVESASLLTIPDEKVNWANDIQTLIYVSCGFDALARDCDRLLSSTGGWTLQSSRGYILFPGSDHIESLVIFCRE